MFDLKRLDSIFNDNSLNKSVNAGNIALQKRQKLIRLIKIAFPAVAAALIGVLAVLPGIKDRTDINLQTPVSNRRDLEKLHMENTVMYVTDKANRVNSFVAQTIDETEAGSQVLKITNPQGTMPTSDEQNIVISAPTGYYDQQNKLFTLSEKVVATYSGGMQATTEEAFYDSQKSLAYGNKPLFADGVWGKLQSQGFAYNTAEELLTLLGITDIKAISSENTPEINIHADEKVEFYRPQKQMTAYGKTIINQKDLTIKSDKAIAWFGADEQGKDVIKDFEAQGNVVADNGQNLIFADRLKAYFINQNGANIVQKADMSGNVHTKTENADISADNGTYYPDDETVVLTGNVIVDNGKNRVLTNRLKAYFKTVADKKVIDKIDMTGGVHTQTDEAEISADKGTYFPSSGIVKMTRNVIIVKNGNRIHGSSAETNLNTGISKINSAGKNRVSGVIYENNLQN